MFNLTGLLIISCYMMNAFYTVLDLPGPSNNYPLRGIAWLSHKTWCMLQFTCIVYCIGVVIVTHMLHATCSMLNAAWYMLHFLLPITHSKHTNYHWNILTDIPSTCYVLRATDGISYFLLLIVKVQLNSETYKQTYHEHAACCMLHAACFMLHVAWWMLLDTCCI